jgi:hypothetical protein
MARCSVLGSQSPESGSSTPHIKMISTALTAILPGNTPVGVATTHVEGLVRRLGLLNLIGHPEKQGRMQKWTRQVETTDKLSINFDERILNASSGNACRRSSDRTGTVMAGHLPAGKNFLILHDQVAPGANGLHIPAPLTTGSHMHQNLNGLPDIEYQGALIIGARIPSVLPEQPCCHMR